MPSLLPRNHEHIFLRGPRSRLSELARVLRISREFIRGFRALHFVGPCVTVFGSARFREGNRYYDMGVQIGKAIANAGFTTMTGGGPGIMEAANRGAKLAAGRSVGCNIILPEEQQPNPYLDKMVEFEYFFVRKVMLVKYSVAFVVLPGGFGTMDELFETATLIQTGKIQAFPVIVMGTDYYRTLRTFLTNTMVTAGTISRADLDDIIFTDDIDEAITAITSRVKAQPPYAQPKPSRILAEKSVPCPDTCPRPDMPGD